MVNEYSSLQAHLTICEDSRNGIVELYDINGTLVLTSTKKDVDISALSSGIYIVKAGSKSGKVVRQCGVDAWQSHRPMPALFGDVVACVDAVFYADVHLYSA